MRRLFIVIFLAVFLQACSAIPFLNSAPPPTDAPVPSATETEIATPTRIPVFTIAPTTTPSPTIVHFPTQDPNLPTETAVPISISIGGKTVTPFVAATSFDPRPGPGFQSVTVSLNKIFWGVCKNNKTTITAVVENPDEVFSVVIFVRLKSVKKEDYTPWTTGNVMFNHKDGTFTYVLRGSAIDGRDHYWNSWVLFQLVATNEKGDEVGRTQIYQQSIALSPCM